MLKAIAAARTRQTWCAGSSAATATEKGVAPDSKVETFAALRLEINSWRWHGVPFYIRAGKDLPVTCTEVVVRFRRPPAIYPDSPPAELPALPHQPGRAHRPWGDGQWTRTKRWRAARSNCWRITIPRQDEMDAYERLLGDAMKGDATLFAREDYVEEAWRIVDPVLKAGTPVYEYEPNTWGPGEVNQLVSPPGGWQDPVVAGRAG